MELIDTHITFTWEELREAILEGTIERMLANIGILLADGYSVSVHTRYAGDTNFHTLEALQAYVDNIALNLASGR